jgi:hypothetical protein
MHWVICMSALAKAAYLYVLETSSLVRLLPNNDRHTAQGGSCSHTSIRSGTERASESSRPCRLLPYTCRVHNNPPKACWLAGLHPADPRHDRSSILNAKTAFRARTTVQARQLCGSFQAMGAICRVIPPIQFARPGRLNFSLLWASDFSGEPNDCGVFTKNLLSSCLSWLVLDGISQYCTIMHGWMRAHGILSCRSELMLISRVVACCPRPRQRPLAGCRR